MAENCIAEIILKVPDKIAKGDAFLAEAISTQPVDYFIFSLQGKKYKIKARQENDQWLGQILLPVNLDEKAGKLHIELGAQKGENSSLNHAKTYIRLYQKNRPVQKLTVNKKYVEPPASEKKRIEKDREKVAKALQQQLPEKLWELPFERPVPGGVSSLFGMRRVFNGQPRSSHKGLDLRGAEGTPIKACADGVVALVDDLYFSGNTVYVNHGDGVFTAYLHMSEPKVKQGQKVQKGDLIGLVGSTGRVTGPHLHLSLIVQGQSVDPQPLLKTEPVKNNKSE